MDVVIELGVLQDDLFDPKKKLERYEFAVMTARLLENAKNKQLDQKSKDAVEALKREFSGELEELGVPIERLDTRVGNPRKNKARDGEVSIKGFAISGADGKWFDAQARIAGESVVVWSDEVAQPVAVSYAWKNNPEVNLVNGSGLPAVPFRTDAP